MSDSRVLKNVMRVAILLVVAGIHAAALLFIKVKDNTEVFVEEPGAEIFKLVDIQEYQPPPPPVQEDKILVNEQPASSEKIIETDLEVEETDEKVAEYKEPEFLPQHKISQIPQIPTAQILAKIEYPPMALKQNMEAVVYLELYIDKNGVIHRIKVLKDPGFGFADAAVKALQGITCTPAMANGQAVAVRFRYPIRFTLQ